MWWADTRPLGLIKLLRTAEPQDADRGTGRRSSSQLLPDNYKDVKGQARRDCPSVTSSQAWPHRVTSVLALPATSERLKSCKSSHFSSFCAAHPCDQHRNRSNIYNRVVYASLGEQFSTCIRRILNIIPALLLYDHLLTFPREVAFVWQQKWRPSTWLFILTWYPAMIENLLEVSLNSYTPKVSKIMSMI